MSVSSKYDGKGQMLLTRTLIATVLILITYNPSGYSFLSFIGSQVGTPDIFENFLVKLFATAVIALGWYIFISAARKSLGKTAIWIGVILLLATFIVIGYINDAGYAVSSNALIWVGELFLGLVFGAGVTMGHFKMWWSGTRQTDDGDDDN